MTLWRQFFQTRWSAWLKTAFPCLLRIFVGRMFHGGGETGTEELGLGIGAILILLAMPGLLVSLLMFEKYGSLIIYLRGGGLYDPFTATIPDEYFFIVLSFVVTGAAALWCWDSIFLNRRDFTNLVPLPVSLRTIFFANFSAILIVASLFTVVVNAASVVLFPIAIAGSRGSFATFLRFATGHGATVLFASAFSFFAVFAIAGSLMALLPAGAFRRVSLLLRFTIAVSLLTLLVSVFAVPFLLPGMPVAKARIIATLPPVSFLGLVRTLWGKHDPFVAAMTRAAIGAMGLAVAVAIISYAVSFRRSFLRTAEVADLTPLPRMRISFSPLAPLHKVILRQPLQRASYHFMARTLLRSDAHLQVVSGFAALGLVAAAEAVTSIRADRLFLLHHVPSVDFLSVPFILGYCIILGVRCAFEIPASLEANWLFKMWLPPTDSEARKVARRVLLAFSVPWLVPICFGVTFYLFGWVNALLHTAVLIACIFLLVEVLLVHFRKIPFTCSYPVFQSHSGVILVVYLFGFFVFTDYLPQIEHWALPSPLRAACFLPLLAIAFAGLSAYRKQMLEMDKQLVFEAPAPSAF
jgi:hypothetical protein